MKLYVAKDSSGVRFFKDCPDLVKFSSDSPVEWTGYPIDFGDFKDFQKILEQQGIIKDLEEYDAPIHLEVSGLMFNIL
jgi:hypothetical protein